LAINVNGGCRVIAEGNPPIQFTKTLPENTLQLSVKDTMIVVDAEVSGGDETILSDKIAGNEMCETLPVGKTMPPVHAISANGSTWYLHDPRIKLADNTLESPLPDGGGATAVNGVTVCSSTARTFLNSDQCIISPSAVACGPYVEQEISLPLEHSAMRDFYVLARRYVYALKMTEPMQTPCVEGTSRWWKVDDPATNPGNCETVQEMDSANTLRSLLESSTDTNAYLKDVVWKSGSGECLSTVGKGGRILLSNGQCWQHVHNDEYNVYDFSAWVTLHPVSADAKSIEVDVYVGDDAHSKRVKD
jgi:hypothetical protein